MADREARKFYKSIHICPECRKNRILGDESTCPECLAQKSIYNKRYYEKHSEILKQKFKDYNHKIYTERSAKGICTRCGKRKAATNRKKCVVCLNRDIEAHKRRSCVYENY